MTTALRELQHAVVALLCALLCALLSRTWFIASVTLLVCGAYALRIAAALTDAELVPAAHAAAPAPRPAAPPAPAADPAGDRAGAAFVARNVFCSSCAPAAGAAGPQAAQGHPAVLIATSVGADARATVRVVPTEVQGSWALGEAIPGVGTVARIGGSSIDVVDAGGHTRTLSLLDAPAAGPTGGAATPTGRAPAAPPSPYAGRIERIDDTTYLVDRGLIRELLSGQAKDRSRAEPAVDAEGKVLGVRVRGALPQTVAAALGLRSGDLIEAIDGAPLRHAQQILDLIAGLDRVPAVALGVKRAGQPLRLTLKLR